LKIFADRYGAATDWETIDMVKRARGALLQSIAIDLSSARPIGTQLCAALRDIILSGGLSAGDRLPATRTLARELSISRTTVIEAFERLVAEGLIESRVGSGSYVSEALSGQRPAADPPPRGAQPGRVPRPPRTSFTIAAALPSFARRLPHRPRAFTTAMPAFDAFPMALWSRYHAKHWRTGRNVVMGYADAKGHPRLRRAISAHLRVHRGIACELEQVYMANGAQQAFQLIGSMLLDPGDRVWFENPGAIGARNALAACGADLVPVPVDGEGLALGEGVRRAPDFRLAFVTPSHQQPLGATMSLQRRFALLNAADRADAMIVEDDYDGEFCYGDHPPPTLKGVDLSGRVFYVGTFSKTLYPALRLGYFVAPPAYVDVFDRATTAFVQGVPSNTQAVIAAFMEDGHFATHIRRMRRIYQERRDALLEHARARLDGLLEVLGTDTGLHTFARLPPWIDQDAVAEAADRKGITVAPVERFCLAPADAHGLVLGFSGVDPGEIRHGVDVLAQVLERQAGPVSARLRG
jgi:GntR family transcriptional regulator/MocR family aminotransferase